MSCWFFCVDVGVGVGVSVGVNVNVNVDVTFVFVLSLWFPLCSPPIYFYFKNCSCMPLNKNK